MIIDFEVAQDCFTLDESLPGGLRFSIHRPKSYFSNNQSYCKYLSSYSSKPSGTIITYKDGTKYWFVRVSGSGTGSHRVIWMLHNQEPIPKGMIIDHKDGNTENNSPYNLRLATTVESSRNKGIHSDNLTGLKGVRRQGNRYTSRIQIDKNTEIYLGTYSTAIEAHLKYLEASRINHKEFSRH